MYNNKHYKQLKRNKKIDIILKVITLSILVVLMLKVVIRAIEIDDINYDNKVKSYQVIN